MTMRKDPMRALGNILPALYEMTNEHDPAGRITFGIIDALPGSSNVVPSMVEFTVDIRHPDNTGYGQMLSALVEIVIEKAAEVSVGADVRKVWEAPGVVFAPECVEYIRAAVDKVGSDAMEIISGAGHDSCAVSEIVPTAMIFIPCEGGLSHNEEESILPGQAAEGVNVLLHSVLNAAKN